MYQLSSVKFLHNWALNSLIFNTVQFPYHFIPPKQYGGNSHRAQLGCRAWASCRWNSPTTAGKLLERNSLGESGRGFPRPTGVDVHSGAALSDAAQRRPAEVPLGSDLCPLPYGWCRLEAGHNSREQGRPVLKAPIFGRNLNKTLSHCAVEAIYVFSFTLNQPGFHTRFGVCQGDADPESRARLLHPEEGRDVEGASWKAV